MPIHPCGMVMDYLRSCFTTQMYLWGADKPPVKVRWFFAAKTARMFPHPTTFNCVDWAMDKGYHDVDDLLDLRGSYYNGKDIVGYEGTNFHGRPEAFVNGGTEDDPPLTTDRDGALPGCRRPPTPVLGSGGQLQGGEGYPLRTGQAQGGTGYPVKTGQVQGGSATFSSGLTWTGSGGQAQGGAEATVPPGGQVQGGSATFSGGFTWTGSGGQVEGGAAIPVPSGYWTGTGGQAQGGAATFSRGVVWTGSGGQVEGGSGLWVILAAPPRVSQVAVEVLRQGSPAARVSQVAVEVLRQGRPAGRVTQVAVEVLRK